MTSTSLVYTRPPTVTAAEIMCGCGSARAARTVNAADPLAPGDGSENVCRAGSDDQPAGSVRATVPSTGCDAWFVMIASIATASPVPRVRILDRGTSVTLTVGRISSG